MPRAPETHGTPLDTTKKLAQTRGVAIKDKGEWEVERLRGENTTERTRRKKTPAQTRILSSGGVARRKREGERGGKVEGERKVGQGKGPRACNPHYLYPSAKR